ncbi:MAG: hypothetical protein HOP08_06485 [Cyclobacteriaceae bacterium]|nr:hypothetical protein [Cyclobacteriaceae bacterium]
MWLKAIFGKLSKNKIVRLVKTEGSLIGEHKQEGRQVYIYLLRDFFVQVMFHNDDPSEEVEHVKTFANINQLNSHLESEFRSTF